MFTDKCKHASLMVNINYMLSAKMTRRQLAALSRNLRSTSSSYHKLRVLSVQQFLCILHLKSYTSVGVLVIMGHFSSTMASVPDAIRSMVAAG